MSDHQKKTELACVQSLLRPTELCYVICNPPHSPTHPPLCVLPMLTFCVAVPLSFLCPIPCVPLRCVHAVNTREWIQSGRSLDVILAVVTNTTTKPDESAIFTLVCHDGSWEIRDVIPITGDISFRFVSAPAAAAAAAAAAVGASPAGERSSAPTVLRTGDFTSKLQVPYFELKTPLSAQQQQLLMGVIGAMGGSADALQNEYVYETSNPTAANTFRAAITKAFSVAKEARFTVNGRSHEWVKYYTLLRGASEVAAASTDFVSTGAARRGRGSTNSSSNSSSGNSSNSSSGSATGKKGAQAVVPSPSDMTMAWIAKMLRTREAEFTTQRTMAVFVGTWNVNGQEPPASLEPWLVVPGLAPDIYCVGFQELDLSASALMLRDTSQAPPWQIAIQSTLRAVGDYVLLQKKQLVGILLFVYVRREHLPRVSDVVIDEHAVGIVGLGNKGGVAIRFAVCDSTFCIVNSHLNAHMENVPRRNQDYHDIRRRLFASGGDYCPITPTALESTPTSGSGSSSGGGGAGSGNPSSSSSISNNTASTVSFVVNGVDSAAGLGSEQGGPASPAVTAVATAVATAAAATTGGGGSGQQPYVGTIFDHDFLFWLGDLNYRIEAPNAEVRAKVQQGDFEALLEADQLRAQIRAGLAFEQFQEAAIRFAPTYKYDQQSTAYDTSSKARVPAWCDRILWHVKDPESLAPSSYGRHELLTSDHRPVSGVFHVKVKTVVVEKRAQVYQDLLKQLDTMENETMPDVQISQSVLDFGSVCYQQSVTRTVTLTNPGMVLARWLFIPKLDQTSVHKPWLRVAPYSGILIPHEAAQIAITIDVDQASVAALNSGDDQLEDVLILHVDKGKDIFLTLAGTFQRSCFGMSLELLSRYPGPVRTTQPLPPDTPPEARLAIPKELWRIVDYLYRFGMEEPDIFFQSGSADMAQIRDCLDTGESFSTHAFNVHSMANTLVNFLCGLSEPVIPASLFQRALDVSGTFASCRQLVATQLSAVHYNTFYYITSFFREVLTFSPANGLTVQNVAFLLGQCLLRSPAPIKKKDLQSCRCKMTAFIRHFLLEEK